MATQPVPIPPSQIIRARRIELVDEHGVLKITLDARAEESVIRLWGKDGSLKAAFGLLTNDQPGLLFLDRYLPRVDLRLEEDGQPSFGLAYDRTMHACEIFINSAERQVRAARRKTKKEPVPRTKK
jgi:hypothetical protein